MKIKIFLILFCVVIMGCKAYNNYELCKSPMIQVGNSCCSDKNNNSICDDLETKSNKLMKLRSSSDETNAKSLQNASWITLKQLQEGINKTFYPLDEPNFSDVERFNVTGIENTFNVTGSARFFILQIKKEYNYIENDQNFTDFIDNRRWH